jgi:hypothetical protein
MNKFILFIVAIITVTLNIDAKERIQEDAKQLAGAFLQKQVSSMLKIRGEINSLSLGYISESQIESINKTKVPLYYVFNVGENNGFVIVSADDRAKTILGYSDQGSFNFNTIPENFRSWLNFYQKELETLSLIPDSTPSSNFSIQSESVLLKSKAALTAVPPLLGNIKWDQDSPYNDLCPLLPPANTSRAVTGCVATAMAQAMNYYNWPVTGTGSHTYTTATHGITLSADFSSTTYDWSNMTDTYSASSTTAQKSAVSTLMYHCGVATDMNYDTSSGTSSSKAGIGLKTYFGYDTNIQQNMRDYYSRTEWVNILKSELDQARPLLYSGSSSSAGHMFVCDGYDANELFHFNWGWSGMSNGYFEITALNPNDVGIGGGNGDGYNSYQSVIKGIQKPNASTTPSYVIYTDKPIISSGNVARNNTFNITVNEIFNYGLNTFAGSLGVGLYNGSTLTEVIYQSSTTLLSYYGWNTLGLNNISVSSGVVNGNYKLYIIYKGTSESNWQIVRGLIGTPNYLNVEITSSNINFSTPTGVLPSLTRNSFSVTGSLYQNKSGRFNVNITNTGGEYNSNLIIYLSGSTNQQVVLNPQNIATGETVDIQYSGTVTVAPGTYNLNVYYDPDNDPATTSYSALGSPISVTVLATPTDPPVLTLTQVISFPDKNNVPKNNAVLTANISNSGGYFENNIIAFIFPVAGGASLGYIGYQKAIIDTGGSLSATFSGNIDLNPGEYMIRVYYYNSGWTQFTPLGLSTLNFTLTQASPAPAAVTTQAVSGISSITAVGNGNLTNLGAPNPTDYGHCWSTQPNPTISNIKTSKGAISTTGVYTSDLTGLTPNATYYIKAYATNSSGTVYGDEVSFNTLLNYSISAGTNVSTLVSGSDVTVVNGGELIINQSTTLNNIKISSGGKLTLPNGNTLTKNSLIIESNASGTGTFVDQSTAETPPGVTATVQQYLSSGRNWYISTPVTSADTSSLSSARAIKYYNEPTAQWLTPASSYLNPLLGYISVSTTGTGTVSFNGTLNSGLKSITLSRTAGIEKSGFNLVGNPYPSYLNWNLVSASNTGIMTTMWYRTKTSENVYTFDTYNADGGQSTNNGATTVTNFIPPLQAFWVRVKDAISSTDLVLNNSMRSHRDVTNNTFKTPASVAPLLRLGVSNGVNSDQALIYFNPIASDSFDSYDSQKMTNANDAVPEIFTLTENEKLVINGMKNVPYNVEIPLGFMTGTAGNFTLKAIEMKEIGDIASVILKDNETETEMVLTNGNVYEFSSGVTNSSNRFSVIFKSAGFTTSLNNNQKNPEMNLISKAENQISVIYNGILSDKTIISTFNAAGTKVMSKNMTNSVENIMVSVPGIYLITIENGDYKLIGKVSVR